MSELNQTLSFSNRAISNKSQVIHQTGVKRQSFWIYANAKCIYLTIPKISKPNRQKLREFSYH